MLLLSGAAVVAAAGLGGAWIAGSSRFAVASVEVSGHSRMTREQIEAAAAIPPGVNLFALDVRRVVERLEAVPLIRRAAVVRSAPDHVTVVVEERRPFTLVHTAGLHWIDEEGVDLGPEPRALRLGAPVLSGLAPEDLAGKGRSSLLGQISEIDVSRSEGPVLYMVDGVEVRLGKEDWEARLGRLQGVLAQLGAAGDAVTSVDLRFRDQVVLRTVR